MHRQQSRSILKKRKQESDGIAKTYTVMKKENEKTEMQNFE